jgi:hypothetical protein
MVLAMLEMRQHEALRSLQGLHPLDASERAQHKANRFRAASARIATVMAKVTIMRLTGTPSLPVVAPVSRQHLAHNNPGVSDLRDLRQVRVSSRRAGPGNGHGPSHSTDDDVRLRCGVVIHTTPALRLRAPSQRLQLRLQLEAFQVPAYSHSMPDARRPPGDGRRTWQNSPGQGSDGRTLSTS